MGEDERTEFISSIKEPAHYSNLIRDFSVTTEWWEGEFYIFSCVLLLANGQAF